VPEVKGMLDSVVGVKLWLGIGFIMIY